MIEVPNLDAMDSDDIKRFSSTLDEDIKHLTKLKEYVWAKLLAMACRNVGDIRTALSYEKDCDRYYEQLPEEYRW